MPRVGLRTKMDIVPAKSADIGDKLITVWLRDISAGGLGFVTSQYLQNGMEFTAIFNRERNQILEIQYLVTHCIAISKGLFSIGAALKR